MNWQKTQSPWLKILAVFGADEPMSSVSAQKQSPWVETVSPRAHEFRHNHKKGPQKTPKFMGSLPHDRAHITCWLGSGCQACVSGTEWVIKTIMQYVDFENEDRYRVAEVAREHGWHPPKSLDSDENFKPEHTLFCRELRFVAIYALFFGDLWA